MTPEPRPARPEEVRAAFELLFSRLPAAERDYRAAKAVELTEAGQFDPRGVLIVPGGVFVCQPVPGAGGLVWPPVAAGPDAEDCLIAAGCASAARSGRDWLNACSPRTKPGWRAAAARRLPPRHRADVPAARAALERHFPSRRLAAGGLRRGPPRGVPPRCCAATGSTLDCPEVNGLRTVEEVVRGHQARTSTGPSRWWLAQDGHAVGVLLVVEPSPGEWEVAYMGVAAEARGGVRRTRCSCGQLVRGARRGRGGDGHAVRR
ncbi:MAG: hypothetical protein U0797_10890 [Gemmataceae bacterium]